MLSGMLALTVASAIREAISDGDFQPGQQLSEIKISQRFECSRNTLREAFAMLHSEGLVERIKNRGVFIATPNADYVRDLYRARAAIEPSAVRWGEGIDSKALVEMTRSAIAARDAGDAAEVSAINQRFHRALVAAIGSPTLDKTMGNLLAQMRLTFLLVLPEYPRIHDDHVDVNARVARLIDEGDREEAATLIRDSLLRTCRAILHYLP